MLAFAVFPIRVVTYIDDLSYNDPTAHPNRVDRADASTRLMDSGIEAIVYHSGGALDAEEQRAVHTILTEIAVERHAEREACAKIAEGVRLDRDGGTGHAACVYETGRVIAAAIRARK